LPADPAPAGTHAWHLFCARHERRNELRAHLDARGVQTQVHYAVPPHRASAFAALGLAPGAFPVAEQIAASALSLPIGPHLADDDVTHVIDAVRAFARS
jgi:dTDP-4-amino-4,6-dideoxygalactose transaminase